MSRIRAPRALQIPAKSAWTPPKNPPPGPSFPLVPLGPRQTESHAYPLDSEAYNALWVVG
jgi:hypothetical protein